MKSVQWVKVDLEEQCIDVCVDDVVYEIGFGDLLEYVEDRESGEMNYVYVVEREDGSQTTMVGQYAVEVGDVMPSGKVVKLVSVLTDEELAVMLHESVEKKEKKKWGKK